MQQETKICQNCKASFIIEPDDFLFYEKMQVPPPTWCPECRLIRRLIYRNERALYKRQCDLCKQEKIFFYPAEAPFPVYCRECWWSDKWDAKSYAKEYDFSKPFFKQFRELLEIVPRPGIIKQGNIIDSEYTNRVTDMRNCYLIFGTTVAENCRYGTWLNESKDCMDCYGAQKSERCYECIDVLNCYDLRYSQESIECRNSAFLYNCKNCDNCFCCVNARNKNYCIFNEQYTKEEYKKTIAQFNLGNAGVVKELLEKMGNIKKKQIAPALVAHHSTDVSGNWIENCKNVKSSFNCLEIEDGKYCYNLLYGKDVMDFGPWSKQSERIYEAINLGIQCANVKFAHECWSQLLDSEYVMNCHTSKNLFGSIGVRNSEYCILNKTYSEGEYKALVTKIKQHMDEMPYVDARGRIHRYGEFFPIEIAPHPYNESLAQEFFPLPKEKAVSLGYPWRDAKTKSYSITRPAILVPQTIAAAEETITKEIIGCAHEGSCTHQCTVAFRIIPEEFASYKRFNIPLPRLCPNCRHFERLEKRNPLKLWPRKCMCLSAEALAKADAYKNTAQHFHGSEHCPNKFETSYSPERKETVYCIQCYQAEIT